MTINTTIEYPRKFLDNISKSEKMVVLVTSRCDRLCSTCAMYDWVLVDRPPHDISMEQLGTFLRISEESGYKFFVFISGGEPPLWPHLHDGLKMIRNSSSVTGVELATNGKTTNKKLNLLNQCLPLIDCLRITKYHDNVHDVDEMAELVRSKTDMPIKISERTTHYLGIPSKKPRSLSAVSCCCSSYAFWGDEVTICPTAPLLMRKLPLVAGVDYSKKYTWSTPVMLRYLNKFKLIRTKQPICSYCVSNKRVAITRRTAIPVATGENI